ncbi:AMP-binding protein [Rhodovastum atsumiense]|uniref:AMP-binding protein n=1 Tax=Rhodovastum atsumiense TaxID=504468 RepID=A0A5M6ITC7_9PROT|nr:AMP-binding protein [Rhodovastum atsumiense]KAA5611169.1 AMP-binding protein [Rhodovastum atsumiense]CAH2602525.1 AMP-binding protein [Rhodovastum atsumiense]
MAEAAPPVLPRHAILRVLRSLLAAELWQISRRGLSAQQVAGWPGQIDFVAELGLDSLETMALAAAVNGLFRLHEAGIEAMLLERKTLGEWADIVAAALAAGTGGVTFLTSGSTGLPKSCPQPWTTLMAETAHWHAAFADRRRIVQSVPSHHIYGFLFTVLLPEQAGWPVLDARAMAPGPLRQALHADDLVVAFPTALRRLLAEVPALPAGLRIVSSTAPLPEDLHAALLAAGAAEVMQVYGSSETAGIGWRTAPDAPFRLLPRWRADRTAGAAALVERATGRPWPLVDDVSWTPDDGLVLRGRRDEAVQVGGVNVHPARVAGQLRTHPAVADCAVRLDTTLPEPRLKAFVVPVEGVDAALLPGQLDAWCRQRFAAAERPVHFTIGASLPRAGMDKAGDWDAVAGGATPDG